MERLKKTIYCKHKLKILPVSVCKKFFQLLTGEIFFHRSKYSSSKTVGLGNVLNCSWFVWPLLFVGLVFYVVKRIHATSKVAKVCE